MKSQLKHHGSFISVLVSGASDRENTFNLDFNHHWHWIAKAIYKKIVTQKPLDQCYDNKTPNNL